MKTAMKIMMLCAVCMGMARASWVADSICPGANGYSSMGYVGFAMDGDGTRGVAYKRADFNEMMFGLCYGSNDGSGWQYEWANGSSSGFMIAGLYTRLAYNNEKEPVIAYTNVSNKIQYAWKNGDTWETGSVTDAVVNQGSMALACDNDGLPHVAYITNNTSQGPHYASFDGSAWSIDTLPAALDVYYDIDLAFDNAGNPHILCGEGVYFTNPGTGWEIDTIPDIDLRYPKIRFDGQGNIRIGCYDDDAASPELYTVTGSAGNWTKTMQTDNGWRCAYAISSGGVSHFGYRTFIDDDTLRYGSTAGGTFSSVMLEPDAAYFSPAGMMVDGDGNIYFAGVHLGSTPQVVCYTNEDAAVHDMFRTADGMIEGLRVTGPNPFSKNTSLEYTVKNAGVFSAAVFDMNGRQVRELARGEGVSGTQRVFWNGNDADNRLVPDGTYFFRVTVDGISRSVPVNLVR